VVFGLERAGIKIKTWNIDVNELLLKKKKGLSGTTWLACMHGHDGQSAVFLEVHFFA